MQSLMHWMMLVGAEKVKLDLTTPVLFRDHIKESFADVGRQMTQVSERILLNRSSQHILEHCRNELVRGLNFIVLRDCEFDDRQADIWNTRFTVDCVELAWKCQWHNVNENLHWKLIFPDCPKNKKVYESHGRQWKDFQLPRSNLTSEDLAEVDQEKGKFFVAWPMLAAVDLDHDEIKRERTFFQLVFSAK
eukprot:TRINITY_DN2927_c0_g1_i2.p1 TRINITY_DN2927_c0_g1~~TRINITY_DN2927_c0_g1_i2.p1  ORF type:complete len:191 (-),score=41.56 TRINITY_DN2927_c0_g1_i2:22-594(-)